MSEFDRVQELFLAARELAPHEREAMLDRECGSDASLRAEVSELLALAPEAEARFETAGVAAASGEVLRDLIGQDDPTTLGPYRVTGRIGEGGMGVVYRAEQTEPVQREVAIKLIRRGMETPEVVARFDAERQALALLDHPGAVTLLDAGTDDGGRPYFVMDLVTGVPITEYADTARLDVRGRLSLFLGVCAVVEHAHQRGVLHRDLKPSNILVSELNTGPLVRVIDFGIAKMLTPTDRTQFATQVGDLVGTPEYMSPEQARGDVVDTRTDVHALGVVLYELLGGRRPFERAGTAPSAAREFLRAIEEDEPPTLSKAVEREAAAARSTTYDDLVRSLRSDLDWVAATALERDPMRRYASVSALASDVTAVMKGEPVSAAPPSFTYRTRKFVARNRGRVVAASLLAASIVAGAVATGWQAVRVAAERDRANQQVARLEAYQAFILDDFLRGADPDEGRDPDVRVSALLQNAADAVAVRFPDEPIVRGDVHRTIAQSYVGLGMPEHAEAQIRLALDAYGPSVDPLERNRLRGYLAGARHDLGHVREAADLSREVWLERNRLLGPDDLESLRAARVHAGILHELNRAEGESLLVASVDSYRRVMGDDHPETFAAELQYASKLADYPEGKEEAERKVRDLLVRVEASDEVTETFAARTRAVLASMVVGLGTKPDEAVELTGATAEEYRRLRGPDHLSTLVAQGNHASALVQVGRLEEAAEVIRETVDRARRTLPPETPRLIAFLGSQAHVEHRLGSPARADSVLEVGLGLIRSHHPESHAIRAQLANSSSIIKRSLGNPEAVAMLVESIAAYARVHGAASWFPQDLTRRLARWARQDGDVERSIDLLEESRALLLDELGASDTSTQASVIDLKDSYLQARRPSDAERVLLEYESAIEADGEPDAAILITVRRHLVSLYRELNRPEDVALYLERLGPAGEEES